jgi:hypothetical protein
VDGNGYYFVYQGGQWSTAEEVAPEGHSINALSCTSSGFCMGVDAEGYAYPYS